MKMRYGAPCKGARYYTAVIGDGYNQTGNRYGTVRELLFDFSFLSTIERYGHETYECRLADV